MLSSASLNQSPGCPQRRNPTASTAFSLSNMLDIHVLTLSSTPKAVFQRCVDSLNAALVPGVKVHFFNGIEGDLGLARHYAFRRGDNPYVGYIDDDDAVEPMIFVKVLEALKQEPDAVYTHERVFDMQGQITEHDKLHNMLVVKRELAQAIDYKHAGVTGDEQLRASLVGRNVVVIPEPLYHYYPTGRSLKWRK